MPTEPGPPAAGRLGAILRALAMGLIVSLLFALPVAAQQSGEVLFVGSATADPVTQARSDGNLTVQGRVVDQNGRPVPGVQVRLIGNGLSTTTVTNVAGAFQATLAAGQYEAELTNRPSQPIAFTLSAQTSARLEFVETPAQVAPGTPSAGTPTAVGTRTPTPNAATRTAAAGTATATPVLTPVPEIGTPIPLAGSAPTARAQTTPASRPVIRRAFEFELDVEPWLSAFLYGVGISTAAAVFYLVIVSIRR